MYTPAYSRQFKRDKQKLLRSGHGIDEMDVILGQLVNDYPLPIRCKDHTLKGEYRECHARPDLLLIYCIEGQELRLIRLGSHAELFE